MTDFLKPPWRPNNKVTGSTWTECARCGLLWPTELLRRQKGLLVCPEDYDEPNQDDLRAESSQEPAKPLAWERDT